MRWWHRKDRERDLERELRADLELEAAEQAERGLSPEEARHAAQRAFGNAALVAEDVRQAWGWTWIESCLQDLRFGTRILVRSPGVSAAIVVSLALGLGATTAMFSLLNALLFKALPVAQPERLVVLSHGAGADLDATFPYPQFSLLRDRAQSTADLFAYSAGGAIRLRSAGADVKVQSQFVSGDYFRVLGIRPLLGRLLEPSDDVPGSPSAAVAVLGYRFWQSAFHGDPSIAGRHIMLDSVPFTIAGVAPRGFFGVEVGAYPDILLPTASHPLLYPKLKMLECKSCYWLSIMGRLQPGVGSSLALANLTAVWQPVRRETIWESMPERYRADYFAERVALAPGATGSSGYAGLRTHFTRPLYVLLAMTGVILLIAASNIANLLMARSLARQRELAVRLSIGARRGRLIRQLLTESALLAAAGLLAGVAVYRFSTGSLLHFLESRQPDVYLDTAPDLRVALFAAATVLLTLGIFGLLPALRATRARLAGALAESSHSVASRSRLSRLLLCGQIAMSFALLVAAILLARSLYDLRTFHAGFRRDRLLVIRPDTSQAVRKGGQIRDTRLVLSEIRSLPGVRSASASIVVPMTGSSWQRSFTSAEYAGKSDADYGCYENLVMPDFFRTVGTRLLMGRDLTERDDAAAPHVAVVNESFARRYWGAANPLGKQFRERDKPDLIAVAGVVEDAKYRDLRRPAPPTVYLPLLQAPSTLGWDINLEIWTYADPQSLIKPVRELLGRDMQGVPAKIQTFTDLIDQRLLYERLLTALSTCFGALAMLICGIGIYGVAAYSVSRRTAEIGVRMALGATPASVVRLVLGEQIVVAAAGLVAGSAGALLLTRFLRTWLFGVSPTDRLTLIAGALCLAAIAALATSIPARRAAGIDPMRALRHE
jgi:predicted permease